MILYTFMKYTFLGIGYIFKYTILGIYYGVYYFFKGIWLGIAWLAKAIAGLITGKIQSNVYRSYELDDVDQLEGHDFEYFVGDLVEKNGFHSVEVTRGSGDHGIDVLAIKDGKSYAIQCKRYDTNVSNKAVQEAYSGKDIYGADIAVVITNQYFTKQAISDAASLGVVLWDRETIYKMIHNGK